MKVNKKEKEVMVRALRFYMQEAKDPCRIVNGPAGSKSVSLRGEIEQLLDKVESLER